MLWKDGKKFDASGDIGGPVDVQLGEGKVMPGWGKGLLGQTVGSRILLVVPAYGIRPVSQAQTGTSSDTWRHTSHFSRWTGTSSDTWRHTSRFPVPTTGTVPAVLASIVSI